MTIYESLKKDHETINHLLEELIHCSETGNEKWKTVLNQIRDELVPHSRAEEAVFYNAIRELSPDNDVVKESYTEHAVAEMDLRTLQTMKAVDINWTNLAKKLRSDILQHVTREETKVFLTAHKLFTDEEAKMISKAFKELKPVVKSQTLAGTTIDLISNLLPRRLVSSFTKSLAEDKKRSA